MDNPLIIILIAGFALAIVIHAYNMGYASGQDAECNCQDGTPTKGGPWR